MKTLNKNQSAQLKGLFVKFNKEVEPTKKENLQKEIIAKFDVEHFERMQKEFSKRSADAPKAEINVPDALSNADGISEAEINNDLLSALNALGITDKLKSNGAKSIFKKDFNNKADRTKCRNAFQNAISMCLLQLVHNKKESAKEYFIKAKEIADKYYLAESAFTDASAYHTNNMDEQKKSAIKLFIENVKAFA